MSDSKNFQLAYNGTIVEYKILEDDVIQFDIKDCATALGRTQIKTLKNKTHSMTIRWERVYEDLIKINKIHNNGIYKRLSNYKKKEIRDNIKNISITKDELLLWCNFVNTDESIEFMQVVSKLNTNTNDSIIIKECKKRNEKEFFQLLNPILNEFGYNIINQYRVFNYRLDGYIPELNIAIEYDEDNHSCYTYEKHEGRQLKIENKIGCKFIRVTDEYDYGIAIAKVLKQILTIKEILNENIS